MRADAAPHCKSSCSGERRRSDVSCLLFGASNLQSGSRLIATLLQPSSSNPTQNTNSNSTNLSLKHPTAPKCQIKSNRINQTQRTQPRSHQPSVKIEPECWTRTPLFLSRLPGPLALAWLSGAVLSRPTASLRCFAAATADGVRRPNDKTPLATPSKSKTKEQHKHSSQQCNSQQ